MNLSDQTLSPLEIQILSKGLSFIPKPKKLDTWELYKDTLKFRRQARIMYNMADVKSHTRRKFVRKSTYNPRPTNNSTLEGTLDNIRTELSLLNYTQKETDNLTRAERRTINELKDKGLIINTADKGSTVVVQDRATYTHNAKTKHLNDTSVYKLLKKNPTDDIKTTISEKLNRLFKNGMINKDMLEFCKPPEEHRTSALYFLKKNNEKSSN